MLSQSLQPSRFASLRISETGLRRTMIRYGCSCTFELDGFPNRMFVFMDLFGTDFALHPAKTRLLTCVKVKIQRRVIIYAGVAQHQMVLAP